MVNCGKTHRLKGEALHKLIQAKMLVPPKKFQLSRFKIAASPFDISEYAPGDINMKKISVIEIAFM